jgi:hypothetical protein
MYYNQQITLLFEMNNKWCHKSENLIKDILQNFIVKLATMKMEDAMDTTPHNNFSTTITDEYIWTDIIFSYVSPCCYIQLMTTCSQFHSLLPQCDNFKYLKLLLKSPYDLTQEELPSIDFFKSSTANRLKFMIKPKIGLDPSQLNHYSEPLCREIMKLYPFDIEEFARTFPWFKSDADKLSTLFDREKDPQVELLEQYYDYAYTAYVSRETYTSTIPSVAYSILNKDAEYRNRKKLVLLTVHQVPTFWKTLSDEMKFDIDVVSHVIRRSPNTYRELPYYLRQNKDIVKIAVSGDGFILLHTHESMRSDKDVVLAAVKRNGEAIRYALAGLENDPEIVYTAVKQYGMVLEYIPKQFHSNRDLILMAVAQNGRALRVVPDEFKNDREVVFTAFRQSSEIMQYVPDSLRDELLKLNTN